jgi:3-deoxy-manno-octulosonate cytidylyltransferase (CMP-KDO synthetase)
VKIVGVIPVRLESKRFPRKPLAKLAGKEIVLRVLERTGEYEGFDRLLVATDSEEIRDLIERHGGDVYFSKQPFRNGSERVAAAVEDVDCDVAVNIQGDEVMVDAELIAAIIELLKRDDSLVASTAAFPLSDSDDERDENLVKVAFDRASGRARKFSRKPIKNKDEPSAYGHIGVYAYRRDFLQKYRELKQSEGELEESLEQLRILDAGFPLGVVVVPTPRIAINTPADLSRAEEIVAREGARS